MTKNNKNILIVYGVYINPNVNWKQLVKQQLQDIQKSGILKNAELHIIISNPNNVENLNAFFSTLSLPISHIQIYFENKFEYWAINHLWHTVKTSENFQYVIYLHTKGMSYYKNSRNRDEKILTYFLFHHWKNTVSILENNAQINKVGLFPSIDPLKSDWGGWIWFNFWWAKAEYIKKVETPIESTDRYYYEHWLSLSQKNRVLSDCFSLVSFNNTLFTTHELPKYFKMLRKKYRLLFWTRLKHFILS
ncbi:hypothetical protein [Acinetobacter rathckeae]|uniref:hypothetical protein n=1 Tax=Acinetobacter rathckeae TaxID=2605272 RepID=UPI0018A28298|nr:hypothetical protein [Acinetobacter rathckeae]MBF7687103.1 hypothetical protein [Acinetobacter rathckeae]MBF7694557.1 hypothetical protein [Acinetobacter rathckeae]